MNPVDLFDALAVLGDAPEGIKRLREMILRLAVRGRLVPQDPDDLPAQEFLCSIRQMKQDEQTRATPLASIHDVESFMWEVPRGWAWVPFGETHINRDGDRIPLRAGDREGRSGPYPYYGASGVIDAIDDYLYEGDHLLVGEDGANLVNRSMPVAFIASGQFWVNNHAHVLASCDSDSLRYLAVFLNAIDLKPHLTGTAQPKLNQRRMNAIPTPVPPLAEQRRIVAKVDELLALLDELERARDERNAKRAALRDSALAALRNAEDTGAVHAAWSRVAANMDDLFKSPADIAPLRQTILQLAVRGRLVPQDPSDPPVLDATVDPTLPSGWRSSPLEVIAELRSGVTKGRKLEGRNLIERPYLRVANVQAGWLDLSVMKTIAIPVEEREKYLLRPGDVVLTEGGDWDKLGRSAVWEDQIEDCLHQNHVFRARPNPKVLTGGWLSRYTNSPAGRAYFQSCSKQTTNLASINMRQLRATEIPLPPLAEQQRILAKVDELMALCDELEQRVAEAEAAQTAFAAAAVHHLDLAHHEQLDAGAETRTADPVGI